MARSKAPQYDPAPGSPGSHHGNGNGGGNKGGGKNKTDPATLKSLIRTLVTQSASSLSPEGMADARDAAADVRYDPLQSVLKGNVRASKQQTKRDKAYFNQYLSDVQGLQGQTANLYANANTQLQGAQNAATMGDSLMAGNVAAQRQASAALTGAPDQSASVNPLLAAQATRGTNALNNQARVLGEGATQGAYLIDQERIGRRGKVDQFIKDSHTTVDNKNKIADLLREKGDYAASLLRDDNDASFAKLLDLLNTKQASKDSNRSYQLNKDQQDYDQSHPSTSSSSGGSKPDKSHPDAHDQKQDNKKMREDARALLTSTDIPKAHLNLGDLVQYLTKQGIDPAIAKAVASNYLQHHGPGYTPPSW